MNATDSNSASSATPRSSVYGPVRSWRYGSSLGIDLLLNSSICSFNCVYCQLGQIQVVTSEQKIYVPTAQVVSDLERVDWAGVDVVTFSGSGEPTLALNLDEVIAEVKARGAKPTVILSNATLFLDAATRRRAMAADEIVCKLDVGTQEALERFNRPAPGVSLDTIVEGIRLLRAEYRGRLCLQCMFMPMNLEEKERVARLAGELQPDEIQINTPRRPYPRRWYPEARGTHDPAQVPDGVALRTVTVEDLQEIAGAMRRHCPGAELISVAERRRL